MKFKPQSLIVLGLAVIGFASFASGQAFAEDDFMFEGTSTGLCLDGHGRGKDVKVAACRTAFQAQRWSFDTHTGQIKHVRRNLCLAVSNSNRANGARVVLWPCNRGTNQRWNLDTIAKTNGPIASALNGKCLDVSMVRPSGNSAQVHMWDCLQGRNQTWQLVKVQRTFKKKRAPSFFPSK